MRNPTGLPAWMPIVPLLGVLVWRDGVLRQGAVIALMEDADSGRARTA